MDIEVPNVDLTTVETGIPILKDGLYDVKLVEASVVPTKDGLGQLLNLKMALEQNAEDTDGNTITPGFPIFDRISLKTTEKYSPARRLAALMDCFLGARTPKLNTIDLVGQTGSVRLKIREDERYGTSNEVKVYERKK